jgi:hypothetical protein
MILLAVFALPAAALDIEHEDYKIIGWNDACSIAVERYAYPRFGAAIYGEPITTRVGTITVELKTPVAITRWVLEADGINSWDRRAVSSIRRKLRKAGYDRPGFHEVIRDSETVVSPGSAEIILSTASLEARPDAWPDTRQWRWGQTHYNPLGTCVLLVYEKIDAPQRFKFLLTRLYKASARTDRSRAHSTNGRLLFDSGDIASALIETEIGARMAPEVGTARYHYAALLALSGRPDDAMRELLAAVERDARYAAKADDDVDFDSVRPRMDFQELILKKRVASEPGVPTLPP